MNCMAHECPDRAVTYVSCNFQGGFDSSPHDLGTLYLCASHIAEVQKEKVVRGGKAAWNLMQSLPLSEEERQERKEQQERNAAIFGYFLLAALMAFICFMVYQVAS